MVKYRIRISQWNESKERFDRSYSEESYDLTVKADAIKAATALFAHAVNGAEVRFVQARQDNIDAVDAEDLFDSSKPARRSSKKATK